MTDDYQLEPPDPSAQFLLRLVPKFGSALADYKQDLWQREVHRAEAMADAAAERIPLDQLFEAIKNDERVEAMFRSAVETAQRTTETSKLQLLGRALASGALAADAAQVDEAQVLLRLAVELEPPDLRALTILLQAAGDSNSVSDPHRALLQRGYSGVILEPVIARLVNLGLLSVESEGLINNPADKDDDLVEVTESWSITHAARALVVLLQGDATEQTSSD